MPDAISQIQARRVADDVYVTFVIPAQNVDGLQPADVARVEIFALTTDSPPPGEKFESVAERITSILVMRPPPPDAEAPATSTATLPLPTGPLPGDTVTIRESLGAAQLLRKPIAKPPAPTPAPAAVPPAASVPNEKTGDAGATSPPHDAPTGPRRYYMAIAVNPRGRSVERGALASVSAASVPDAPTGLHVSYSEESVQVSWTAVAGASGYNVYLDDDAEGSGAEPGPPWAIRVPAPLNPTALPTATFSEPVVFGRRRCYRVRAVGPAAAMTEGIAARECVTPEDRFPPAAPTELAALTAKDGITVRWAANTESDLGGYRILRGRSGDAKLQQIAAVPPAQTQYLDREVMPGVRYVYAVVAVDSRKPEPNASAESNRDDATAP